jgi:hypothetical protein
VVVAVVVAVAMIRCMALVASAVVVVDIVKL